MPGLSVPGLKLAFRCKTVSVFVQAQFFDAKLLLIELL